ncbi:MAG TPA: MYXO-CTERM sorting domain-containing protein, partial [Verrucomicrobiae bacterium]|nr:MYXO-CTERM sorting domain-containing protein [Verrucomicrobiae bacterium]
NGDGTIGEYSTFGTTVNSDLISGLVYPGNIAIGPAPEPPASILAALGAAAFWLGRRRKTRD